MATTTIFNNALLEMARGTLNFGNGANTAYKVMLLSTASTYTVNKAHSLVSDVSGAGGSECSGTGYITGGVVPANITTSIASNAVIVAVDTVAWANSTISAKAAILYHGPSGKLIAYVDFGTTVASSNSTLTVSFASPLKLQN